MKSSHLNWLPQLQRTTMFRGKKRLILVRRGVSVVEVIEGNGTEWNLFVCKGKRALKRSIISVYCNIFLRLTNMDNETK